MLMPVAEAERVSGARGDQLLKDGRLIKGSGAIFKNDTCLALVGRDAQDNARLARCQVVLCIAQRCMRPVWTWRGSCHRAYRPQQQVLQCVGQGSRSLPVNSVKVLRSSSPRSTSPIAAVRRMRQARHVSPLRTLPRSCLSASALRSEIVVFMYRGR